MLSIAMACRQGVLAFMSAAVFFGCSTQPTTVELKFLGDKAEEGGSYALSLRRIDGSAMGESGEKLIDYDAHDDHTLLVTLTEPTLVDAADGQGVRFTAYALAGSNAGAPVVSVGTAVVNLDIGGHVKASITLHAPPAGLESAYGLSLSDPSIGSPLTLTAELSDLDDAADDFTPALWWYASGDEVFLLPSEATGNSLVIAELGRHLAIPHTLRVSLEPVAEIHTLAASNGIWVYGENEAEVFLSTYLRTLGMLEIIDIMAHTAVDHSGFAVTAIGSENIGGAKSHAEHIANSLLSAIGQSGVPAQAQEGDWAGNNGNAEDPSVGSGNNDNIGIGEFLTPLYDVLEPLSNADGGLDSGQLSQASTCYNTIVNESALVIEGAKAVAQSDSDDSAALSAQLQAVEDAAIALLGDESDGLICFRTIMESLYTGGLDTPSLPLLSPAQRPL